MLLKFLLHISRSILLVHFELPQFLLSDALQLLLGQIGDGVGLHLQLVVSLHLLRHEVVEKIVIFGVSGRFGGDVRGDLGEHRFMHVDWATDRIDVAATTVYRRSHCWVRRGPRQMVS